MRVIDFSASRDEVSQQLAEASDELHAAGLQQRASMLAYSRPLRPDPNAPKPAPPPSRVEHVFADDDHGWLGRLLKRWGF